MKVAKIGILSNMNETPTRRERRYFFPHFHLLTDRAFPPSFVPVADGEKYVIGILPVKGGKCEWVSLQKGKSLGNYESVETTWGRLSEKHESDIPSTAVWKAILHGSSSIPSGISWKDVQRSWLQNIRRQLGWEKTIAEIGVSKATWQGWEGGKKPFPYFQAGRIANLYWIAKHPRLSCRLGKI